MPLVVEWVVGCEALGDQSLSPWFSKDGLQVIGCAGLWRPLSDPSPGVGEVGLLCSSAFAVRGGRTFVGGPNV